MIGQTSAILKRAEVSGRETRNSELLNIPFFKTSTGQRNFYYETVSLWNSLKRNLKLGESLNVVKGRLHVRGKLLREFCLHNTTLSHNSTLLHIMFITPWYLDLFHFNFNETYLVIALLNQTMFLKFLFNQDMFQMKHVTFGEVPSERTSCYYKTSSIVSCTMRNNHNFQRPGN